MPNTFFWSDQHFGHANILNFEKNGRPLRPFVSVEDMDETMIENYNRTVKPADTCWFLGDVVINRKFLKHIGRMHGRKRLILGNHDIFKNRDYYNAGFEDLHAFHKFDTFVCTHIPVHSDNLGRWGTNVHGHTHKNNVKKPLHVQDEKIIYSEKLDLRYVCVCVEQINYTPINLEELRLKIKI